MNLSFIKRLNAIQRLGYLGLIPFVLLPPISALGLIESGQALRLFQLYSALILGFMAGVLWPVLYQAAHPTRRALVAVVLPVASIVGFAFLRPPEALVFQAALFLGLRLFEYLAGVDRQYPARYPQLRWQLTAVVVFMHLLYALVW